MTDGSVPPDERQRQGCGELPNVRRLVEGALTDGQADAVGTHIASCASCTAEFEQLLKQDAWLEQEDAVGEAEVRELGRRVAANLRKRLPESMLMPVHSAPTLESLMIPGYDQLELIGEGGMGIVYRARNIKLNRIEAVKVLAPHLIRHATARERFIRESRAGAAISDDHVVRIHSIGEANGWPYLTMEFIEGESLQETIDRIGMLPLISIVRIALQVARGLAAAHSQGVIHRDIKPANILLANGCERAFISDFGLARVLDDVQLTRTGVISGTPEFMSPEQANGDVPDERSDLFSLGALIYSMAAGYSPFRSDHPIGVIRRVTEHDPKQLTSVNPEVPMWLSGLVHRLLAKDPDDRLQSASEVAERLQSFLAHLQQPQHMPLPATIKVITPRRSASRRIATWIDSAESFFVRFGQSVWACRNALYVWSLITAQIVIVVGGSHASAPGWVESWLLLAVLLTLPVSCLAYLVLSSIHFWRRAIRVAIVWMTWLIASRATGNSQTIEIVGALTTIYAPVVLAMFLGLRAVGIRLLEPADETRLQTIKLRELFAIVTAGILLIGTSTTIVRPDMVVGGVINSIVFAVHWLIILLVPCCASLARLSPKRTFLYLGFALLATIAIALHADDGEPDLIGPLLATCAATQFVVYLIGTGFRSIGYRLVGLPVIATGTRVSSPTS